MPRLINYLNLLPPGRTYDEFDLARLQLAYEKACEALTLPVGDPRRETVAHLIFELEGTTTSTDEFVSFVMSVFRQKA